MQTSRYSLEMQKCLQEIDDEDNQYAYLTRAMRAAWIDRINLPLSEEGWLARKAEIYKKYAKRCEQSMERFKRDREEFISSLFSSRSAVTAG